jgi:hypothetical protein
VSENTYEGNDELLWAMVAKEIQEKRRPPITCGKRVGIRKVRPSVNRKIEEEKAKKRPLAMDLYDAASFTLRRKLAKKEISAASIARRQISKSSMDITQESDWDMKQFVEDRYRPVGLYVATFNAQVERDLGGRGRSSRDPLLSQLMRQRFGAQTFQKGGSSFYGYKTYVQARDSLLAETVIADALDVVNEKDNLKKQEGLPARSSPRRQKANAVRKLPTRSEKSQNKSSGQVKEWKNMLLDRILTKADSLMSDNEKRKKSMLLPVHARDGMDPLFYVTKNNEGDWALRFPQMRQGEGEKETLGPVAEECVVIKRST